MTTLAKALAPLPSGSFFINKNPVCLSTAVTIAPLFPSPTIVSISQSPKRSLPLTMAGLSSIETLSLMTVLLPPTVRFRCLSLCLVCLYKFPPSWLVFTDQLVNALMAYHWTALFLGPSLDLFRRPLFFGEFFPDLLFHLSGQLSGTL